MHCFSDIGAMAIARIVSPVVVDTGKSRDPLSQSFDGFDRMFDRSY
jgi:hypothetical protein